MSFQLWCAVFIGMVLSILLLNIVQWTIYRDRSYGLYTGYMLAWVFYFGLRIHTFHDWFPAGITLFILSIAPMAAYETCFLNKIVRFAGNQSFFPTYKHRIKKTVFDGRHQVYVSL